MRIIFLTDSIFSDRDYERFGIDGMKKRGAEIENSCKIIEKCVALPIMVKTPENELRRQVKILINTINSIF